MATQQKRDPKNGKGHRSVSKPTKRTGGGKKPKSGSNRANGN
jgi:hypothetical protein